VTAASRIPAAKRVAIVTGGTRGIGAEISRALAAKGYAVVAFFVRDEAAAERFRSETGCIARRIDVSSPDQCDGGTAEVLRDLGRCDVLVNNAGTTSAARVEDMAADRWRGVIEAHLGGCFNMTRSVLPAMRSAGYGRLVHIGSVVARTGAFGIANYAAAKAGIEGFSRAVALEGARLGITSNVVAPGYIDAGMIATIPPKILARIRQRVPVGRLGEARDVARAVLFLADENAGFITGATLPVNGGLQMG